MADSAGACGLVFTLARLGETMRLLDLFCGAGGAAYGYHQAGFADITGVDHVPQPRYPYRFVQADALEYLRWWGDTYDVIHASPPCQAYSSMTRDKARHPDLYIPTRDLLAAIGKPWVLEDVIGSPYQHGILLCGSMFGLRVRRHRNFETSHLILSSLQCEHEKQGRPITVTGHGGGRERPHSFKGIKAEWPQYMGMPWATPEECTQAVPPAYTAYLGRQLRRYAPCAKSS